MVYSKFLNAKKSEIRLETSDYEKASYEEQLEWQHKIFIKGVGLESYGGSESYMELSTYRLGEAKTQ
jgi:hypothetical protein